MQTLETLTQGVEDAKRHWWLFMLLGIVLLLSGIVVIGYPLVSSVGAVMVLGVVLIISRVSL
jgi:uncharacterized membrane protein HdeD (DUF308 family)